MDVHGKEQLKLIRQRLDQHLRTKFAVDGLLVVLSSLMGEDRRPVAEMPSVLYKIRSVMIDPEAVRVVTPLIQQSDTATQT